MNLKNYIIAKAYAVETGVEVNGRHSFTGFSDYMKEVYTFSLKLGSLLAILMFVYAGYKYIFSRGDEKAVTDAKDIMWGAILGVIILYLAKYILQILGAPDADIKPTSTTYLIRHFI